MTILIRDRAQEDKVVKVIEPSNTVNLTFDWENNEGRLAYVKSHWPNYNGVEIDQIHKLYYGDYLNSEGKIDNVLMKVRQSTNFGKEVLENVEKVRTCNQCPVFDELDKEIEDMLATQNPTEGGNT